MWAGGHFSYYIIQMFYMKVMSVAKINLKTCIYNFKEDNMYNFKEVRTFLIPAFENTLQSLLWVPRIS